MNNERILRVTNWFLIVCGYQLHEFECKTRRYRLSVWALLNFFLLLLFYIICFGHHFEVSGLLQLLRDVTPFLRRLVRLQFWLGLKIMIYNLCEMKWVVRGANDLSNALPRVFARKWSRDELIAYLLLFSTFFISSVFVLYIAYEMEFELPPRDHILIAMALFIPHFMLAGALRFLLVGSWLLRQQLRNLLEDVESLLEQQHKPQTAAQNANTDECVTTIGICNVAFVLEPSLKRIQEQLELLAATQKTFTASLRRQLLLLIVVNSNCLLAGVYIAVYFRSIWHVMFSERTTRIFHAANLGIFMFIFWDYLCLCWMQVSFSKIRRKFYRKVVGFLKVKLRFPKSTHQLLKEMRNCLCGEFEFKLFGNNNLDPWQFVLVQILIGGVIALLVGYQHFNDKIVSLNERVGSVENVD